MMTKRKNGKAYMDESNCKEWVENLFRKSDV